MARLNPSAQRAIGTIHSLVTALDALAAFGPVGFGSKQFLGFTALSGASKVAVVGSDASTTLAHLYTTVNDLKNGLAGVDVTDPKSLGQFIAGMSADLAVNGLDETSYFKTILSIIRAAPTPSPPTPSPFASTSGPASMTTRRPSASTRLISSAIKPPWPLTSNPSRIPKRQRQLPASQARSDASSRRHSWPEQPVNSIQSGDPNDKFATGIGAAGWVPTGTAITYTIDFQNETNASAAAQKVSITDPLTANLIGQLCS